MLKNDKYILFPQIKFPKGLLRRLRADASARPASIFSVPTVLRNPEILLGFLRIFILQSVGNSTACPYIRSVKSFPGIVIYKILAALSEISFGRIYASIVT